MNRKFAALALASTMLVPATFAGDPDPKAAEVVQQIEARRAAKAQATADAAKKSARNDPGERVWNVNPGQPGGAIGIQRNP